MREDMFKVIVERPRRGGHTDGSSRQFRNSEERGGTIGMKQGHTSRKWLNENLAPLRRWLMKQAGRPWNKVYSELSSNIDRRNTVQEHIHAHIDQFVERETYMVGKQVYFRGSWRRNNQPIEESGAELYVHPLTGILLENRKRRTWKQRREAEWAAKVAAREAAMRELTPTRQLRKLQGCWYEVQLSPLPEGEPYQDGPCTRMRYPAVWDVALKRKVSRAHGHQPSEMHPAADYGKAWVYASFKRQLSTAELKLHKLVNGPVEDPPPTVANHSIFASTKTPGCPGVFVTSSTSIASRTWFQRSPGSQPTLPSQQLHDRAASTGGEAGSVIRIIKCRDSSRLNETQSKPGHSLALSLGSNVVSPQSTHPIAAFTRPQHETYPRSDFVDGKRFSTSELYFDPAFRHRKIRHVQPGELRGIEAQ